MSQGPTGGVLGGALLVAGTSIGAGMLALPVLTAWAGFVPTVLLYLLCWAVMTITGLLFVEVCLWLDAKGEPNIISMAGSMLGTVGKAVSWFLYLYLFYSLTIAYISGGGGLLSDWLGGSMPDWIASLIVLLILAPVVFVGAGAVDRVNSVMIGGLILSYGLFLIVAWPYVDADKVRRMDWSSMAYALPVVVTSFGFQGLVPSLTAYLRREPRKVAVAIIAGSAIPLVCYILWEWLILGIVPFEGPYGLIQAVEKGETAVAPLRQLVKAPWIFYLGQSFAFFALISSFLGVALGLRDFLADGLRLRKTKANRLLICTIMFLPAYVIACTNPRLFLMAVKYGGGIGIGLLLALLPVVLVWVGRYRKGMDSSKFRVPGGRWTLCAVALFVLVLLVTEFLPAPSV